MSGKRHLLTQVSTQWPPRMLGLSARRPCLCVLSWTPRPSTAGKSTSVESRPSNIVSTQTRILTWTGKSASLIGKRAASWAEAAMSMSALGSCAGNCEVEAARVIHRNEIFLSQYTRTRSRKLLARGCMQGTRIVYGVSVWASVRRWVLEDMRAAPLQIEGYRTFKSQLGTRTS